MLKLSNIEVAYNQVILALRGISLVVPQGGIITLLGPNGAGKSTVLKSISGIIKLQNGKIVNGYVEFLGKKINEKSTEEIVKMGITHIPEGRQIFPEFTVEENLKTGCYLRKDKSQINKDLNLVKEYFPILAGRVKQLAGYLSGGEQQMLAISRGLMSNPKLMVIDEPSLGLAPLVTNEIFEIIRKINQEKNMGILLVEQNANIAISFSDYGYIIENGRIVLSGSCKELKENQEIKKFYLGIAEENFIGNNENI